MAQRFTLGNYVVLDLNGTYREAPYAGRLALPYGPETIFKVTEVRNTPNLGQRIRVSPISSPQDTYGEFSADRFKLAGNGPNKPVSGMSLGVAPKAARAMSVEMAREQKARLVAAGVPEGKLRIRSRSWDNDGKYFAVEANGKPLYLPGDVDAFIANIAPIDLPAAETGKRLGTIAVYKFKVGLSYVPNPYDGSYWWSGSDIVRSKGRVTFQGKTYRLGETRFVPFA